MPPRPPGTKGFKRTSTLLQDRIRQAGQNRGFAETRLLTRWQEIAGDDIAKIVRPVEVSYTKQGLGATLTLLTTGANAPVIEMQKETLRTRINAVYGYNAISRIRITQTAPVGFAEGQAQFDRTDVDKPDSPAPTPVQKEQVRTLAKPIHSDVLREALEKLGQNILSRS